MGILSIVATPIGNLEDITLRALRTLKEADYVLCEDTRNSRKLLDRFEIKTPTVSYHQHSKINRLEQIVAWLKGGKNLALISDAGTPGLSDPGGELVALVRKSAPETNIICIPGASALSAAISIAGLPLDRFNFFGFLPHKKGRQTLLKEITAQKYPVILYESKYRVVKLLQEIIDLKMKKNVMIFKELTKIHERVYSGLAEEILVQLEKDPAATKGEFVVIIH